MHKFLVTTPNERPDFRLVITFLWHDGKNVDTEGNSHHPASKTWTELYVQNRENEREVVKVSQHLALPLTLEVESESQALAARVALFLATHCKGLVTTDVDSNLERPEVLYSLLGNDFDREAAFSRVAKSPFANSSLDNPFPNLDRASMLKAKKALGL